MIFTSIIAFVIILGLLVIIHEIGHFIFARLFKVGVDEFGVGFPPRITGIKKGKTLYSLNWIPIGGFVKIKGVVGGDQMDSPAQDGRSTSGATSDSFMHKPLWQRFAILFAGIGMNLLLASVLFAVGYMIGMPSATTDLPRNAIISDQAALVVDVDPSAPAAGQGLQAGDQLVQINNQPVYSIADVKSVMSAVTATELVNVDVQRETEDIVSLSITPTTLSETGQPGLGAYLTESGTVRLPWHTAIWYGAVQTWNITKMIILSLGAMVVGLFQGDGSAANVSGPIGIATLTYQATQLGFVYLLQFAALLSINLAIFNLLPIPALDGGRILFLAIEAILRRPLNQRAEAIIHNIGFIALLLLIMAVTIKDVFSFF